VFTQHPIVTLADRRNGEQACSQEVSGLPPIAATEKEELMEDKSKN